MLDGDLASSQPSVTAVIVDEFIEKDPRIGEIDVEQVGAENLARASSHDLDDDMVTETLAKNSSRSG